MCTLKINVLFSYSFVGKVNEIKLKLVMEYNETRAQLLPFSVDIATNKTSQCT